MIELNWLESQIVYYSKNWFKTIGLFEDIKKLCSIYYSSDIVYYDDYFVLKTIIELYCKINKEYENRITNDLVYYFTWTDINNNPLDKTILGTSKYFLS